MKTAILFLLLATTPVGPHFTRTPAGWAPSCPASKTLVRHAPAPDCIWGTKPMASKPTEGEFECMDAAKVKKLPVCPA